MFKFNPFTGTLDLVDTGSGGVTDHGALTGLADDDHLQYLLLAGRPGTTNDPLISTDATGTITGSGATGEGLTLIPNDADTTGKVSFFDPDEAFVHTNVFGKPALILGPVDPSMDLAGGSAVARLGIFDNDLALFILRSDEGNSGPPRFIQAYYASAADAPVFGVLRARGNSFAGRTQPVAADGLFAFSVQSYKDDQTEMDDFAGAFGFEVDDVFPDYVTARLGFSIMFDDGVRRHPVYFFPNDLITFGADLRDTVPPFDPMPSDHTVHMESWSDKTTVVIRAAASQTEALTQWRDDADDPQTLIDFMGILKVAEVNDPGGGAIATPQTGMIVFDTNISKFVGWDGAAWQAFH